MWGFSSIDCVQSWFTRLQQSRFSFPFLHFLLETVAGRGAANTSLQAVYCVHPLHIGAYLLISNLRGVGGCLCSPLPIESDGYVIILLCVSLKRNHHRCAPRLFSKSAKKRMAAVVMLEP